jgi:hypothetical protein
MRVSEARSTDQGEDTLQVMPTTRVGTVEVTADGEGLVSHAGAALLVEVADRVGLTAALSEACADTRERRSAHDPGRVIRDVVVMLADGGDCVTDIDAYQGQERLFGARASETTTHRVLKSVDDQLLGRIRAARAQARIRVWDAGARPDTITLNIDATLLTADSDKELAAGNYKHGYGFHPLNCFGRDRRGARRDPAAGERGLEHRRGPLRGAVSGARAAAGRRS